MTGLSSGLPFFSFFNHPYSHFYIFILVGKLENEFLSLIENETPLSLLEECYTSVYSVARFYMENSVEPSRVLNNSSFTAESNYENFFFSILIFLSLLFEIYI